MTRGGGRINLGLARDPRLTADPSSVGLGVVAAVPGTFQRQIVVRYTGRGSSWTATATAPTRPDGTAASGVAVSVRPTTFTLAAGNQTVLTVEFVIAVTALGQFEGDIVLVGPLTLRIPYWLSVGPP